MTRKDIKAMGITDEEQITALLNALKGEIEDFKETYKEAYKPAKPVTPAPEPQPAAQTPASAQASAPDEIERIRRELAAEKEKNAARELRDTIMGDLAAFNPRNPETLYRLLDPSQITVKDGKVVSGLKEQIEPMKTAQGYLFTDTADDKGGAEHKGATAAENWNSIIRGGK